MKSIAFFVRQYGCNEIFPKMVDSFLCGGTYMHTGTPRWHEIIAYGLIKDTK